MRVKIAPHIAWQNVEGDLALFDSRDGSYRTLNGSGAAIWRAIALGQDIPTTIDTLARSYAAHREEIAGDVREFIETALSNDLLVSVEET